MRTSKWCARPGSDWSLGMAGSRDWFDTSKPWIGNVGGVTGVGRREKSKCKSPRLDSPLSLVCLADPVLIPAPPPANSPPENAEFQLFLGKYDPSRQLCWRAGGWPDALHGRNRRLLTCRPALSFRFPFVAPMLRSFPSVWQSGKVVAGGDA